MSIIRVIHNKENPYVLVNKSALLDQNLSLAAVGLWARLLANKDDWQIRVVDLSNRWGVGKGKIQGIFRELTKAGYAYRWRTKLPNGRYADWNTALFETPMTFEEIQKMFPELGFPALANAPLISNLKEEEYANAKKKKEKTKQEGLEPPTPEEAEVIALRFQAHIGRRPLSKYPIPFPDAWRLADLKRLRAERAKYKKEEEQANTMQKKSQLRILEVEKIVAEFNAGPGNYGVRNISAYQGILSYQKENGAWTTIPEDLSQEDWETTVESLRRAK